MTPSSPKRADVCAPAVAHHLMHDDQHRHRLLAVNCNGLRPSANTNGIGSMNWSNVTDPIQDDGTTKTLILNPSDASRLFRLVLP